MKTRKCTGGTTSEPTSLECIKERVPLSEVATCATTPKSPVSRRFRPDIRKRPIEDYEMEGTSMDPIDSLRLRPDVLSDHQTPGIFKFRRRVSQQPTIDYFSTFCVPIEVLRQIFKNLNKRDMCSAMLACRFFYNAGKTCDNWDFVDMHNKRVIDTALLDLLERKVQVLRMGDTHVAENRREPILYQQPTPMFFLTHLDMGRASFVRLECLAAVLRGCRNLRAVCLEGIDLLDMGTEVGQFIGQNPFLSHLDLSLTAGLTEDGVRGIVTGCRRLEEANFAWCGLSQDSVQILATQLSPTVRKINLSGTEDKGSITDQQVFALIDSCPNLVEVDLSDNLSLDAPTVSALAQMNRLEVVSLNRCYSINPTMFLDFSYVKVLNVHGTMTADGERRLKDELTGVKVNQEILNYIAKPTVPPAVSSIWGQRTRDVY